MAKDDLNKKETPAGHFMSFLDLGEGATYSHAHIHLRLRHVHHKTKDQLFSVGSQGILWSAAKGSFICTIPQRTVQITSFGTPVVERWLEQTFLMQTSSVTIIRIKMYV